MKPELRRLLPLPAAFLIGVLSSLLLAPGPRSTVTGDGGQAPWELPAAQVRDLATADEVWGERHPWGRSSTSAAEAAALAVPVAMPVGVVEDGSGLRALFSLDGALPVAVEHGGNTPDGGTVTSIASTVVTWLDADGDAKRLELFQKRQGTDVSADNAAASPQSPSERRQSRRPPARSPL